MFDKVLVPLYMLYCMDGEIRGRTRFQKLVFLTKEKMKEDNQDVNIQFNRLYYGPFSRELMESLKALNNEGLMAEQVEEGLYGLVYVYKLTDNGKTFIKDSIRRKLLDRQAKNKIKFVARDFGQKPLDELISFVYSHYPDYDPHKH
jgi:uncharacterized protein YwgA